MCIRDRHISRILPYRDDDKRGKGHFGGGQPRPLQKGNGDIIIQLYSNAAEDELPDEPQYYAADEVGREKAGAQKILAAHTAGEAISQKKGQKVDCLLYTSRCV